MNNLLAFDLGASNGRAILGQFNGEKLVLAELHRFENHYIDKGECLTWDLSYLLEQLKYGLCTFASENLGTLDCVGIDNWGVDYGLLDPSGMVLGNPRSYRMADPTDLAPAWEKLDERTLFYQGGIDSRNPTNTLYQLYRRVREKDSELRSAQTLLLLPDLLAYLLTGEAVTEYTNATTTMLCNPETKDWSWSTIAALGLPRRLFTRIDHAGSLRGRLLESVADSTSVNTAPFAAVGTHDTASAVAAIPAEGNFAFCSSGTWSLFGTETTSPLLTDEMWKSGFSNEGTVQGGFRPLKNIAGLWLIQECRRCWMAEGTSLSWDDIVVAAQKAQPLRSVINPDTAEFFSGGNMIQKIRDYCRKTNQPEPETIGQVARCVYESLALKYRWALEKLEKLCGKHLDRLYIVGGGAKNHLLNQMAADSLNRPTFAGPVEAAAVGNLLTQAMALGKIKDITQLRQIVRNSFTIKSYMPRHTQEWAAAYQRLCSQMDKEKTSL